jgi:O-antigen/teichoic acid export membrane protein
MSTDERIGRIGRNTAFNAFRSAVGTVVAFATGIVVARFLGPSDTGIYALAIWVALAVTIVVSDGLALALTKAIAQQDAGADAKKVRGVVVFGIGLQSILVVLGAGALALASGGLAEAFGIPASGDIFLLAALLAGANAFMNVFSAPLNGLERQGLLVPLRTVWVIASFVVTTIALVVFDASLEAMVAAQVVVWIFVAVLHLVVLSPVVKLRQPRSITPETRRTIMRSSLALTASSALGLLVFTRSAVFLLGLFADTDEVAFYSIAYAMAEAAQLWIPAALALATMPTISRALAGGDLAFARRAYEGQLRLTALAIMPVAVVGALLATSLVRVFYGQDFAAAAAPLAVLLFAIGVRMLAHCATWVLVSNDEERLVVVIYGACAAVNVGLGLALIPDYGIDGALIAETCTQLVFMTGSMVLVWRRVGFGIPASGFLRIGAATVPVALSMALLVALVANDVLTLVLGACLAPLTYAIGLRATRALSPFEKLYLRERLPAGLARRAATGVSSGDL